MQDGFFFCLAFGAQHSQQSYTLLSYFLYETIAALAIFGVKVYRGGVLMYGKGTSFKNIFKALDLTKKG